VSIEFTLLSEYENMPRARVAEYRYVPMGVVGINKHMYSTVPNSILLLTILESTCLFQCIQCDAQYDTAPTYVMPISVLCAGVSMISHALY
jgi:hypothetical protein